MNDIPTTKHALIERNAASFTALDTALGRLSDAEMLEPVGDGGWTRKGVLAHLMSGWLSGQLEAWRIFDAHVRQPLGMSGEEFVRKLDSGEIVDDDTDHHVILVEGLIPSHIRYGR